MRQTYDTYNLKPRNHLEAYCDAIGVFGKQIEAQLRKEAEAKAAAAALKPKKRNWLAQLFFGKVKLPAHSAAVENKRLESCEA